MAETEMNVDPSTDRELPVDMPIRPPSLFIRGVPLEIRVSSIFVVTIDTGDSALDSVEVTTIPDATRGAVLPISAMTVWASDTSPLSRVAGTYSTLVDAIAAEKNMRLFLASRPRTISRCDVPSEKVA